MMVFWKGMYISVILRTIYFSQKSVPGHNARAMDLDTTFEGIFYIASSFPQDFQASK